MKVKGHFRKLKSQPLVTWSGWLTYQWDMGICTYLTKDKPVYDKKLEMFDFVGIVEGISPDFLESLGIIEPHNPVNLNDDDLRAFFYTEHEDCEKGYHPPIPITLILPGPLLEQLGLDSTGE